MFRPVRTLFLMVLVFLAGVFFERYQHGERCAAAGGQLCRAFVPEQTDDR